MINIWDMRWIFTTHISAANISNPNLHIKVQHFRFIWGCMDSPRVDRWDFLMVCVKRKHSTFNKKSSAPYRCFFLLGPLASKKTGKFVARQQGLQLWWLLHFQSGLLLLLLHRSLVCFFFFLCHLGWFGMRFCCVFTGVLGKFGWFSDTPKKVGPDFERGSMNDS